MVANGGFYFCPGVRTSNLLLLQVLAELMNLQLERVCRFVYCWKV